MVCLILLEFRDTLFAVYPHLLQLTFVHTLQCCYISYLVVCPINELHVPCYFLFTTAMADFPHVTPTEVELSGAGQDTEGDEVVGHVPLPVPSTGEAAVRATAMLSLQEAIMFTGSAPPFPPRPAKFVSKDQPTPQKASLNDPLTPKTMDLLKHNGGCHERWFVQ